MEKSGYGRDGVYRSLRPPLNLPKDPNLSLISFLFRNISNYQNKPALIDADSGDTLTFSDLKSAVFNVSAGLIQLGIRKNDVVLIFSPNSIQFPLCFFGIIAAGAVATTVNPTYTVPEIAKQIKDCKPKLIITVPELWDKVKVFNLPLVILGKKNEFQEFVSNDKITLFTDLVKNNGTVVTNLPKIGGNDTAALLYSSGTTGTSKGVVLSHRNFISAALMLSSDQEVLGEVDAVYLCVVPMFHVFGLALITFGQLQRGSSVVSMGKFEFEMILKTVDKYRVTHLWVVPPIILALAKQSLVKKYDLSSLRQIGSGAAPLGKELMQECAKNFPNAMILQVILLKFGIGSLFCELRF